MDIVIVGGGPAGLYFALLMKKADPGHRVRVFERNRADDTFGFGVVFSDETLSGFQDADPATYRDIIEAFAYWDKIDVLYRGERIRSGGHGFCGMSRKRLLNIFRRHCAAAGVEIRYETEITDLAPFAGADLVVAADGINSLIREAHKEHFRPSLDWRRNRFVWLGSTLPLDAFTFIFEQNAHGLFSVHAYQFQADASTFIVECADETWRRAGLDRAGEADTLAYCETLFAGHLSGHRLLANNSVWRRFPTVRNEHWSHGNIVLMGDALHTAHFSIGSGTKLAMEDAIALFEAYAAYGDTRSALAAFEAGRKDEVARLQRTAETSLEWFENAERHMGLDPIQFAFNLLSRSKRVTYDNLRLRDAAFVSRVDRRFAADAAARTGAEPVAEPPPPMFTPFRLRGMTLDNRVVVSPMCQYSAEDGSPDDWHLVHIGARAVGGAGLVVTEMTDISADGRISPGCAGMYRPEHAPAWKRIVDFVHAHSRARICMQLAHAGRKGSTCRPWQAPGMDRPLPDGNWPLVSASPIPYVDGESQVPRAMDRDDMDRVCNDFVRAAGWAEEAGFDMLELHMAHGYLLSSFISPLTNRRGDNYGGALENRMRYPLEIFDAVRAAWPEEKPMAVRISATDWIADGGLTGAESVGVARMLKAHGCDIIDVSAGQTTTDAEPVYGRMFQTPFADRIRHEAGIPTITVGNITTADQVNTIVAAGRADLCALARPHLADPYFTLHAAARYGVAGQAWPKQYLAGRDQAMTMAERANEEMRELRAAAAPPRARPPSNAAG